MKLIHTTLMLLAGTLLATAFAEPMSSSNYALTWAVNDNAANYQVSANYALNDSVGQSITPAAASGVLYSLASGFFAAPDTDTDQVRDFMDNCLLDINTSQYDSNGDGFGNLCDPDLDDSGFVNFADYAALTAAFLSTPASPNWNAEADLTGDNVVNFGDLSLFQFFFLQPPGPSGIAP